MTSACGVCPHPRGSPTRPAVAGHPPALLGGGRELVARALPLLHPPAPAGAQRRRCRGGRRRCAGWRGGGGPRARRSVWTLMPRRRAATVRSGRPPHPPACGRSPSPFRGGGLESSRTAVLPKARAAASAERVAKAVLRRPVVAPHVDRGWSLPRAHGPRPLRRLWKEQGEPLLNVLWSACRAIPHPGRLRCQTPPLRGRGASGTASYVPCNIVLRKRADGCAGSRRCDKLGSWQPRLRTTTRDDAGACSTSGAGRGARTGAGGSRSPSRRSGGVPLR